MDELSSLLILIFLVCLSGIFSASETALTAFKRIKLKEVEEENPKAGRLLKLWLKNPNEILTTILLGNNVVNILASIIATRYGILILVQKMGYSTAQADFVVLITLTSCVLIFGEITPKIIAKKYSDKISKFVIIPIFVLSRISIIFIWVLTFFSKTITRIFGIKVSAENQLITEEDIRSIVNVGEDEGVIEQEEKEMIHSIFEFGDRTVREVIIPRTDMFSLEASDTLEEIWDKIIEMGYSRIPVYEGKIDNIIGIVYVKDLLSVVRKGKLDLPIKNFLREAYFVPETKSLIEQLKEFREKKVHIAIVIDEYGGTVGLCTMEDLLEEIVGEINDEFDDEDEKVVKISDKMYRVDPIIDIQTVNKELNIEVPQSEEYDTLGGFIYSALGRVPEAGDKVREGDFEIEVKLVNNHRINMVCIELLEETINEEN